MPLIHRDELLPHTPHRTLTALTVDELFAKFEAQFNTQVPELRDREVAVGGLHTIYLNVSFYDESHSVRDAFISRACLELETAGYTVSFQRHAQDVTFRITC